MNGNWPLISSSKLRLESSLLASSITLIERARAATVRAWDQHLSTKITGLTRFPQKPDKPIRKKDEGDGEKMMMLLGFTSVGGGSLRWASIPSTFLSRKRAPSSSSFLFAAAGAATIKSKLLPGLRDACGFATSRAAAAAPLCTAALQTAPIIHQDKVPDEKPQQWKAAIDFKWIRDNKEAVATNIRNRNSTANLELVLDLYDQFSTLQKEVERLRGERNAVANKMKGKLEPSVRQALIEEGKNLKEGLLALEEDLAQLTEQLQREAQCIPNLTHPDVPIGGEDKSVLRKTVGSPRQFGFPIKDHVQLGKELDLFDFDAAAEVSGSKFYYLKNEAVLLEMALVNWALSEAMKRGFVPLATPEIVRSSVVEKCGFQPRGQNTQVYSIEGSDQCLIGTAEIPVGGIHIDSILSDSQLPLKYVAFSHCFRTEAGAAGTATRGLYRVHQFSKVEMFILCRPEESDFYHDELIKLEEDMFTSLGLHFKILDMSSEDLGAPAYRKFDIEAWMPGLGRYGEISSASNCTDYQSRRLGIRYRPSPPEQSLPPHAKKGKSNVTSTQFVHTLNATACAVPRMMICLLENFQQEDGSVVIPQALRPFIGGLNAISPRPR